MTTAFQVLKQYSSEHCAVMLFGGPFGVRRWILVSARAETVNGPPPHVDRRLCRRPRSDYSHRLPRVSGPQPRRITLGRLWGTTFDGNSHAPSACDACWAAVDVNKLILVERVPPCTPLRPQPGPAAESSSPDCTCSFPTAPCVGQPSLSTHWGAYICVSARPAPPPEGLHCLELWPPFTFPAGQPDDTRMLGAGPHTINSSPLRAPTQRREDDPPEPHPQGGPREAHRGD